MNFGIEMILVAMLVAVPVILGVLGYRSHKFHREFR